MEENPYQKFYEDFIMKETIIPYEEDPIKNFDDYMIQLGFALTMDFRVDHNSIVKVVNG